MSLLEDLPEIRLDEVDDATLEEIVMKGRIAREQTSPQKEKKAPKEKKPSIDQVDLDDFV